MDSGWIDMDVVGMKVQGEATFMLLITWTEKCAEKHMARGRSTCDDNA